ncbi:lebercilin-like protein isoform X2 [Vidua macroura]|nr:lebercilin-like protein isoform X2 [Vidua macroura]XP_053827177.1 lebercilin-like protein isoform X2 [Vidua macroura]XP_053827178.1 lebercilin-like protein isoform X2 [Vidua macroura]XP_053827179.1 lebercilin-like protein isoform X2 [Vidua macroura]
MIPRAFSVTDSERVRGGKPLETAGTEKKETQKKAKTRKERKKCGQCLYTQGDKKGGKKWPAAKTSNLNNSFLTLQSGVVYQDKNATAQRISSARIHKIKELKNEIFDLQRKIETSSFENLALKELNRRHARAINRYSNAESHLQELLAGHRNELTDLRNLLKTSQEAEKNTARELKKVEAELRRTKDDLKTLLVLSEDKALAEREELNRRLSILNKTLEAKDERIQSLEMQLKLNSSTFSRQLASESKKLLEATMTTKNLLMEINIIHQKIKEKDRQLYVQNIYANRMPKALRDRSDWDPNDQSLRVDRSVQVDKESFRELLLSQHQETIKNPIQLKKEKRRDKGGEGKAEEVCSDGQGKKEKQATKKVPETSNRTHREGKLLMEERKFSEFIKEMEKETEVLKNELKTLMKSEKNPQRVKENNHEGEAVEEIEKEEKNHYEQQKKKARSEGASPSKDPTRLKKNHIFSEAVENLHQGFHTSGAKCKAGSQRQSCSDTAVPRGKISFGAYEPSFGQTPLGWQDSPSGVEETPDEGALWGGMFARRQLLQCQQRKGEGRQVRGARQIPNSMPGSNSPR